jgi:Spy/CpxP family protein refolding chaperone
VLVLAGLLAALTPLTLAAQPAAGRPRPRDEAFKMIDAYIVSNMQEALGISDDQYARLLPLVTKLQRDRRALVQRRIQALQELNRVVRQGGATEARVGELLRELKAVEAEEPATIRRDMDAVDAVLTPLQQAKYRLLEVEVERRLRALMSEMRGANRARRGREMPEN